MDFKNLEDLKTKLREISQKGFIENKRPNNVGGVGNTLEDELEIAENNLPEGDFKIGKITVELKTQRKKASNRITLSTKEPIWIIDKKKVITKTGYKDVKGRIGLKIILNTLKFNDKGYKLELGKNKLFITHRKLGKVCFFDINPLMNLIKNKMGENLLLVLADVKKKDNREFYLYSEAILFSNFCEEKFKELINSGQIIWEFRLHFKPSGAIRDHGSGFRINRKFLSNLYKNKINLIQ